MQLYLIYFWDMLHCEDTDLVTMLVIDRCKLADRQTSCLQTHNTAGTTELASIQNLQIVSPADNVDTYSITSAAERTIRFDQCNCHLTRQLRKL